MTPEQPDPLLASLAELTGPLPAAARDARVRARCHAAMTTAGRRPSPLARTARRAIDGLWPVAVLVYAVVTLAEGLRTLFGR
jgi:hypothetical protein